MGTQAKILKTCNCCLPRNQTPRMMGARAEVKYCKSCKMTTIWGVADLDLVKKYEARIERVRIYLDELMNA